MKAVLQRISKARVVINHERSEEVSAGLLVLFCAVEGDTLKHAEFLSEKIINLRIFTDENDKMNLSLTDVNGEMMIISNFTLCADARKGKRPSYTRSASPEEAKKLYEVFIGYCRSKNVKKIACGEFGADMQVELTNDGPVTVILDTDEIMKQGGAAHV
mgnify:CR=1 FL=1